MKMLRMAPLLLAVWLLSTPAAFASDSWYTARIMGGDTPLRIEHFWSKGRKVRMQTIIRAQPFVTIVSGEYYTVIDTVRRTAVAIRRNASALKLESENKDKRPFAREADRLVDAGAEQVGSEKIGGRQTRHYRVSNRLAASEAWVSDDEYRLPMRVIRYDRTSGSTLREDFVDWARELDLPETFFQPGGDIAVERLEYDEFVARDQDPSTVLIPILIPELLHGR